VVARRLDDRLLSAAGSVTGDVKNFQGTEKEKVVLEQKAKIGRQEFIPELTECGQYADPLHGAIRQR
jgi:hypothetical protein